MNIITKYLIYRDYKKKLKSIYPQLRAKYKFTKNFYNEFYTVLDLRSVPDQVKQEYGLYWKEQEIQKFLLEIQQFVDSANIHDELGIMEIKEIDTDVYGICFGIKRMIFNPRTFLFFTILTIITILLTLTIIIL